MVKLKATKKEMRNGYRYILGTGYCTMQSLLKEQKAIAYSAGVYGWACDYYDVDGVLISTGYSPLYNKNVAGSYPIILEYENKALAIDEMRLPLEERKENKTALIKEMLDKFRSKEWIKTLN